MRTPFGRGWGAIGNPLLCAVPLFLLLPATICHAMACEPVNVGPIPTITSVTPSTFVVGHTYNVVITGDFPGDGSMPGCFYNEDAFITSSSLYTLGPGVNFGTSDPYVSIVQDSNGFSAGTFTTTQITLTVKVKDGAQTGTDYLQLVADGGDYFPIFPVQIKGCADETIASVSPNIWFAGKAYTTTITGTNFITKEKATKLCPVSKVDATATSSNVSVSDVTVVSDTQITATIKPAADSPIEQGTVTVNSVPSNTQIIDNEIQWNNQGNNQIITGIYSTGTQQVVVGQQILLTTNPNLPGNITVTSSTWTVGGTKIAGYTASTSASVQKVTDADLKNANITFYWVYPTDSAVTYNYCVNIPGLSADDIASKLNCSLTEKATFNVTGPGDAQMTTDPYSSVNIVQLIISPCLPVDLTYFMQYGQTSGYFGNQCQNMGGETGTPGVLFTAPGSSSPSGIYSFVQKINHDSTTYSFTAGTSSENCSTTPGLDGQYPYPLYGDGEAADAPSVGLLPVYRRVSRNFAATMYLLWTSSISNSIPVPIGYQKWHFQASTRNPSAPTKQSWTTPVSQSQGTDGAFVPAASSQPSDGYPTWSGKATPNCPTVSAAEEEMQEEE